jgi:hypothetical protein
MISPLSLCVCAVVARQFTFTFYDTININVLWSIYYKLAGIVQNSALCLESPRFHLSHTLVLSSQCTDHRYWAVTIAYSPLQPVHPLFSPLSF